MYELVVGNYIRWGRVMKKSRIMLLSTILIIVLCIGAFFLLKDKGSSQSKEDKAGEEQTVEYENGDFVYLPSSDDIGFDEEEGIYYYENLLNIYLSSEISDEEAEKLADTVDGTVVGKIAGAINLLQFQVEEGSIDELKQLATTFEEADVVEFASTSTPSFISDVSGMPNDSKDQEEADWWPEAINAPDAWRYIDENGDNFKEVNVGVLETGKLGEKNDEVFDADLEKSVEASNKNGVDFIGENRDGEAIYKSHPRWVTKFIVADPIKNEYNFRGVATDVANVHFTALGNSYDTFTKGESVNGVPEPYIFSTIEAELEKGVKIINNSWGFPPMTEENWKSSDKFWKREGFTYKGYLKSAKKSQDKVSAQLIIALNKLLKEDAPQNDFLIIQGAGNGKSIFTHETDKKEDEKWSASTATEAKNSGFFTNINDDTYDLATDLVKGELENDLVDILSHIIIVGGAEPMENNRGYQSPEWASYGDAIDIVAPASNLRVDTDRIGENDQIPVNGTSFATPMVSGAAALVWSFNPGLKASEVKDFLLKNSVKTAEDNEEIKDTEYEKQMYPMLNATSFFAHYYPLMETYREAVKDRWSQKKLDERYLGPSHYEPHPLPKNYGYELRDINGNGTLELILGIHLENGETEVQEIYTLQDNEPVKIFANGIRTNIEIYKDGTISHVYGVMSTGFYTLSDDGTYELEEGYEINDDGKYKDSLDSDRILTETEIKAIHKKYEEADLMQHSFTPFVLETEENNETEKDAGMSDEEAKDIMRENYSVLGDLLLEDVINDLYEKYHDIDEAQDMWKSGVDPNTPFYNDVHELLYPKVKHLVAEEGMESLINEKFSLYWSPPSTISFYGPSPDLEVLGKTENSFKIKLTKEIGPQDIGGKSYDIMYIVKYVKEDDEWKFAGVKKQK